jgi:hypothetical protein
MKELTDAAGGQIPRTTGLSNVLANIWDKGTEDVIAAPDGSVAFREMVAALLDTEGSEESGPPARNAVPAVHGGQHQATRGGTVFRVLAESLEVWFLVTTR